MILISYLVRRCIRLVAPFGLAVWSVTAPAQSNEQDGSLLAHPLAAGDATRVEVTVAFVSDGYRRGPCKIVESSGDKRADAQACRTVSFYKTTKPLYAVTSAWLMPEFEGEFIAPKLKNSKKVAMAISNSYPRYELSKGHQGTTSVKLVIDITGKVTNCIAAQSSGYATLDRVTCKQMMRAKYNPGQLNGEPTESIVYTSMFWGAGSGPPEP
ncbi:energy transducer TonB [Parasphingorhabdus sp.]|uniref:energy transducer TonB n=1 Tax=Parasphingorhabdus sp. TaxID=2709688 RepID=UPI0039E553A7